MPPGKKRCIGREVPGAERFVKLVEGAFSLSTAKEPERFLQFVQPVASLDAYSRWLKAYRRNDGSFLDHPVWGADRNLGGGRYLYGAMDDRYASNAARVFVPGGLNAEAHVRGKTCCVIGAWDGTECLLLRAMGAAAVDSVDEMPALCDMAGAQYATWNVPGEVRCESLYETDVRSLWQRYDLVYVPGVLYHLTDLPLAFVILWSTLKTGGVLAVESICDTGGGRGARYLGPSTPGWNWWAPTAECAVAAMRDCGFPDARTVERASGRGWWIGTRGEDPPALRCGAAGFSRPDVLRTIGEVRSGK